MVNNQRQRDIIDIISQKGNVTVDELAEKFNVSKMTIRRDLEKLQEENYLQRTHGGALVNKVLLQEMAYHEKREEHLNAKKCIARKALEFIEENMTVYLDAGTTTYEIARILPKEGLTVITNDIRIAVHLMPSQNLVYFLGGLVMKETGSTTDTHALNMLKRFNIDVGIIATSGVDKDLFLCTPEQERMVIKQTAVEQSDTKILVTDASKFYRKSLYKIVQIHAFDYVITDLDKEKLEHSQLKDTQLLDLYCPVDKETENA
ncbi:MAG: DeoR/GlpR family DNA-binding transcription regulator [Bacillota bacterium]